MNASNTALNHPHQYPGPEAENRSPAGLLYELINLPALPSIDLANLANECGRSELEIIRLHRELIMSPMTDHLNSLRESGVIPSEKTLLRQYQRSERKRSNKKVHDK